MTNSIMITGAGGQLGGYAATFFAERQFKVISCGGTAPPGGIRIDLDITNAQRVNQAIDTFKPDFLINYAAISSPRDSIKLPAETFRVNQGGVFNILEAIRLHSRNTRALFIGSSEMFGKKISSYETFDEVVIGFQDEGTALDPKTPYAASKAAAHSLVDSYRASYGLSLFNLIQFGTESSRRSPSFFTKKVTHFVGCLNSTLRNQKCGIKFKENNVAIGEITIPKLRFESPLNSYKDFSYISDVIHGHFLIATKGNPGNYVVGSGQAHSLEEFVQLAFKFAQFENYEDFCIIPEYEPNDYSVGFSFNDYICSKPDKLRRLGWTPRVSFNGLVFSLINDELSDQAISL